MDKLYELRKKKQVEAQKKEEEIRKNIIERNEIKESIESSPADTKVTPSHILSQLDQLRSLLSNK